MLRKVIAALVIVLASSAVFAQWNPPSGGGPIYYTGGNVGIGTTTPQSVLHVTGSPSHALVGNGTDFVGVGQTGYGATNGAEKLFFAVQPGLGFFGTVSHTNVGIVVGNWTWFYFAEGGKLGIANGINPPVSNLDVNGNASIGTYAGVNAAPTNGLVVSGSVGIGTASPGQKLSVAGTIESTSGGFKFPDGSTQNRAYAPSSSGALSLSGSSPQYLLASTSSTQQSALSTSGFGLYLDVIGHATPANNFISFRTTNVANSFNPVEAMRIASTGSVEIGTPTPDPSLRLNVNGNATISGTLTANSVVNAIFGQDVAEWVRADRDLAPGTVVILNPDKTNEVMPSSAAYDTSVAGVVSAQPGVILGRPGAQKATVATSGRVRVRVDARQGAIRVGDLLVTSDEPGMAMKSRPIDVGGRKFHQPGTILGKALEPLSEGVGEILVLLCLG